MKAIILAAGKGTRLNNLTKEKPKCMCKVFGRTLISRCIQTLEESGINRKDIVIITGYKGDKINISGVNYIKNEDYEKTNMFVTLTKAEEYLKKEDCIVIYSDIIFHKNAVEKLLETNEELAITSYNDFWNLWSRRFLNPLCDLETFKTDDDDYLLEIGKKPLKKEEIMGQFMGLIKFTPKSWKIVQDLIKLPLEKKIDKLDMTTLLNELILKDMQKIKVFKTDDLWLECDNENDINFYEQEFKNLFN